MNVAMFIVGFCIFAVYVGLLMWNIFYNHNKNREENYPGYYTRHKQPGRTELMTGHYQGDSIEKRFKKINKTKRKKFNNKV